MEITNMISTIADPYTKKDGIVKGVELDRILFTKSLSESEIKDLLILSETNTEIEVNNLKTLLYSILALPNDNPFKEEYLSRQNSLDKLYRIYEEMVIKKNKFTSEEINYLSAILSTTYHCPLRNLLEKELISEKEKLNEEKSDSNFEEKELLQKIKSVKKVNLLDEILCEHMIDEYINLGKVIRMEVVKRLFEVKNDFYDEEEIFLKIKSFGDTIKELGSIDIKISQNIVDRSMVSSVLDNEDYNVLLKF